MCRLIFSRKISVFCKQHQPKNIGYSLIYSTRINSKSSVSQVSEFGSKLANFLMIIVWLKISEICRRDKLQGLNHSWIRSRCFCSCEKHRRFRASTGFSRHTSQITSRCWDHVKQNMIFITSDSTCGVNVKVVVILISPAYAD